MQWSMWLKETPITFPNINFMPDIPIEIKKISYDKKFLWLLWNVIEITQDFHRLHKSSIMCV
jgi:hypothetical protein